MKNISKTILLASIAATALNMGAVCEASNSIKVPRCQSEDTEKSSPRNTGKMDSRSAQKIDADIEKNRKADAVVNLGEAAPGGDVKVEQLKHDFIFGAHIFNFNQLGAHEYNERYKRAYGELFNSATVPFYWSDFETQPGRPRFVEEYRDTEEFWNNCKIRKTSAIGAAPRPTR